MRILLLFAFIFGIGLNHSCATDNAAKKEKESPKTAIENVEVNFQKEPEKVEPIDIMFKVNGVAAGETIYLAKYTGKKLYYNDTTVAGKKGEIKFKTKARKGGVYSLVLPGPKLFELVIGDNESIQIELDTLDLIGKAKIVKSENNKVYYDYLRFIDGQKKKLSNLQTARQNATNPQEEAQITEQINSLDAEVKTYMKKLVEENPNLFVAKLIKMSDVVELPEPPRDAQGNITDSLFQYRYYRDNFFRNIDLRDDRTAASPLFGQKLEQYVTKVIPQTPDSIIKYADLLAKKVEGKPELTKLIVSYIADYYGRSQFMGMDRVFVHMVENYYMTQNFDWIDAENLEKLTDRAMKLKPTLIGNKAPALYLADTTGNNYTHLYSLQADFTILYFWDPTCGHCKKVTPKLAELVKKDKYKGVKVYAVNTDIENKEWIKYMNKNDISIFTNVSDTPKRPDPFRSIYDIYSTPKVFLLDAEKKILAKQIDVEQIEELLEFFMKNPNK
jgi:thiol-disulfide isomerase/thioredoxin